MLSLKHTLQFVSMFFLALLVVTCRYSPPGQSERPTEHSDAVRLSCGGAIPGAGDASVPTEARQTQSVCYVLTSFLCSTRAALR